ncbi:hypothetical protein COU75_04315 [Candidatus Peregrinibacteria bacterium CG10_big_fil_rev_8_21_14_0_10_42_8]|nr:MAG: hypothetical protein COU75_04315 [Candidatus Peregrinibacteria bacterium CG10_big_fil_rev_8_21_14_0_10_42_8]
MVKYTYKHTYMKNVKSHTQVGFKHSHIHKKKEPHAIFYLKQRMSFWIATLSVFMFIAGNMVGQHGMYAFFASVLGDEDNTAIAYMGTVQPVASVVDYSCWAKLGGDWKVHTFRQAPESCHRTLPMYQSGENRDSLFSMGYMSSYEKTTEGSGTHDGIDIRVPVGTPVLSTMNGRIVTVGDQPRGYGKYIVVEHPDVPDPEDPTKKTTTLYTTYAHLSAFYVQKGDLVQKGNMIALSGSTGQSSGPHLHFQIDREEAPFHPYYATSQSDGYEYTVHPMLYVQSQFAPLEQATTLIARTESRRSQRITDPADVVVPRRIDDAQNQPVRVAQTTVPTQVEELSQKTIIARLQARREERVRERIADRDSRQVIASNNLGTGLFGSAPKIVVPEVASDQSVTEAAIGEVASVEISHDGYFTGRGWEKLRITLLDADGNVVKSPRLNKDLVLRTAYGEAEFRPATISPLDFVQGDVTVHMLPRGRRTVVIKVLPFDVLSRPMEYNR